MSAIDIRHPHSLPPVQARKAVEQVARKLGDKFGLQHQWQGDILHFEGSGVNGHIALTPKQLHVTATLGFLLSALKGPIESEIRRILDERFA